MKLPFLPKGKPKIGIIKIHGEIHSVRAYDVERSLRKIKGKIDALFVVVNSTGGSAVQSQIISEKLRNFCQSKHIKYWTFAEDNAVSGGYLILAGGTSFTFQPTHSLSCFI